MEPAASDSEPADRARALLRDPRLLCAATDAMGRLGAACDEGSRALLYLAITSRLIDRPVSLALRGASPERCRLLIDSALALMPEDALLELTSLQPKALEHGLRHKHLVVKTIDGRQRALLSELAATGSVRYLVRGRSGKARHVIVEGPIGVISSGARLSQILIEDRAAWPLSPGDGDGALSASAGEHTGVDLAAWHALQRQLRHHQVVVPFARALEDTVERPGQHADELVRLMSLIKASALLHQRQRDEAGGRLLASLEDYCLVYPLVDKLVTSISEPPPGQALKLTAAVRRLCQSRASAPGGAWVDKAELIRELGWAKRTVNKWVAVARVHGLVDVERSDSSSAERVRPRAEARILPTPEALAETDRASRWLRTSSIRLRATCGEPAER